jgi:amidase
MVATHLGRLDRLDALDPRLADNVRLGIAQPAQALAAAERDRAAFRQRLLSFFETHDVLLCPTTAVMPFDVALDYPAVVNGRAMRNYVEWLAPTFPATLAGLPALAVPSGLSGDGLPIGLQIVGKPHHEEQLLAVGAAIEQAYPFVFPPLRNEVIEAHHGH